MLNVSKFFKWLKKPKKAAAPPTYVPSLMDVSSVDKMTLRKTRELLAAASTSGRKVTGFILMTPDGTRTLVELGAVCSYTNEAFWDVMHPTPVDIWAKEALVNAGIKQVTDEYFAQREEDPTEGWYQQKFDFTKIRSVKDTIADLQELVDLTAWQQDTVSRAAVWLSGLAEVNDAWWTEFIRLVDLLTEKPDDDHTRESLIELVSRVVATPVDAH